MAVSAAFLPGRVLFRSVHAVPDAIAVCASDMPQSRTIREFYYTKTVTDDQVNPAVEAYLADPETAAAHPIADAANASRPPGGRGRSRPGQLRRRQLRGQPPA